MKGPSQVHPYLDLANESSNDIAFDFSFVLGIDEPTAVAQRVHQDEVVQVIEKSAAKYYSRYEKSKKPYIHL